MSNLLSAIKVTDFNPYLDAYNAVMADAVDAVANERWELAHRYAWAVPNATAIARLVELGPIVEIGAGAGYWAALIAASGGDIIAYDNAPASSGENGYTAGHEWHPVECDGPAAVTRHQDRALLLCWPPFNTPMAATTLSLYEGDTVAYVGEGMYGMTADDAFHDALSTHWRCDDVVHIPSWPSIGDRLTIWTRR